MVIKNEKSAIRPETINRHINSVYPALAMLAGMQLEVFTFLGEEEKSAQQLANEMKVSIEKVSPLLYALVSGGLLQLSGEGFVNTIEAQEFLVKGEFLAKDQKINIL